MPMTNADSASDRCAARVDAVVTQLPRLRGPQALGRTSSPVSCSGHPMAIALDVQSRLP